MAGILAVEVAIPGVPQIAVFDTAFHQTMLQKAYLYPKETFSVTKGNY
jgi:acetate kinase